VNSEQSPLLPAGFRASGIACGIKDSGAPDLALFVSDMPCSSAGVFTRNRVYGAPVQVCRERVPAGHTRAVIINSGNANACTGERGLLDARWMTEVTAQNIGCEPSSVLVCSTGVIGHYLPRSSLAIGIPEVVEALSEQPDGFQLAARAMMTTDTVTKQSVREVAMGNGRVCISGAAKGAAMIAPNMATMLAVVMTDAVLSPETADAILRHAVDRSFNCISVEGHTSTSDTVLILANGRAGEGPAGDAQRDTLQTAINEVCEELAEAIIRDAEGADHFVTIDVQGLATRDEAFRIAKTIADSPMVKTAITGNDPNWGRIVSAAGYSGVELSERDMSLKINGTLIYEHGAPVEYDESALSAEMQTHRDVHIELQLAADGERVRFQTCDLTAEYVRLNSDYTT